MKHLTRNRGQKGLSLLETSLALAILASLSAGIFVAYRSQQDGFSNVLSDLRAIQQADEALNTLVRDMSLATAFSPTATDSLTFTVAAGNSTLRLGSPIDGDPRNRPLLYDPAGPDPERELTRARILQNHNPSKVTLQGASPDGTVPLFSPVAANPSRVTITLVVQARPSSPVRYLRTSVTRRHGVWP